MNLEPPKIGQIAEAISAWNPAANEKLGHAHEIFSALLVQSITITYR
jgi:Ca2+/H+ antiporter